jgi:hypothetical protein
VQSAFWTSTDVPHRYIHGATPCLMVLLTGLAIARQWLGSIDHVPFMAVAGECDPILYASACVGACGDCNCHTTACLPSYYPWMSCHITLVLCQISAECLTATHTTCLRAHSRMRGTTPCHAPLLAGFFGLEGSIIDSVPFLFVVNRPYHCCMVTAPDSCRQGVNHFQQCIPVFIANEGMWKI